MGVLVGPVSAAAAVVLAALTAPPAAAIDVDLELVLAVDVSRSVDEEEEFVQRRGYVEAFRHPSVAQAIQSGLHGRVAVTYIEWAGSAHQVQVVPWRVLASPQDAGAFADELAAAPLTRETRTSISTGLQFAADLFSSNDAQGTRRAIDISGDGPNNAGRPVLSVRKELIADGVVINGLPVLIRPTDYFNFLGPVRLDHYYRDCVIGGDGAFLIAVEDESQFIPAIRRKLVLEIAGLPPRVFLAADEPERPPVDCLIGERARGL